MKRALQLHEDLRASVYSEVNIDVWVEPMEGKRGTKAGTRGAESGVGSD